MPKEMTKEEAMELVEKIKQLAQDSGAEVKVMDRNFDLPAGAEVVGEQTLEMGPEDWKRLSPVMHQVFDLVRQNTQGPMEALIVLQRVQDAITRVHGIALVRSEVVTANKPSASENSFGVVGSAGNA